MDSLEGRDRSLDPPARARQWPDGPRTTTLPHQPVVYHDQHALTDEDRAAAARGEAIFVRGGAVAAVEYICRLMGDNELFWYFVEGATPYVIEDLHLPRQSVSSGGCSVAPDAVLAAGRAVRRRGGRVVAAGHSHGRSVTYSSAIDLEQARTLLAEACARETTELERVEGVREPAGNGTAVVAFPGTALSVELRAPGEAGLPDGLAATLVVTRRRRVSTFATANARAEHLFPAVVATNCPTCDAERETIPDPGAIVVHVIGPVAIDPDRRAELRREVRSKVTLAAYPTTVGYGASYGGWERAAYQPAATSTAGGSTYLLPAPAAGAPAGTFSIYRDGRCVGIVDGDTLAAAAASVPALARALSWYQS
jgi:hypothetical protein